MDELFEALRHHISELGYEIAGIGVIGPFTVQRPGTTANTIAIHHSEDTKIRLIGYGETPDSTNTFIDLQEPNAIDKIEQHLGLYL